MTRMARVASVVLALLVVVGLAAPSSAVSPASAPAAKPAAAASAAKPGAKADVWGTMCVAGVVSPALGAIGCGKKVADKGIDGASKAAAKKLSDSVLGDFSKATAGFVSDMLKKSFTWWLTTDSVQIKDSGVMEPSDPKDPSKSVSLHAIMLGIGTFISILLMMFAGIRTMIQRKGQPIAQAVQGLLINCLVIAVGVSVIDSLLVGSDALTKAILQVGFGGDAPEKMVAMLLPQMGNPAGLLAMALVGLLVGGVQVVLLFLRQAAIPIQALLLPIAGSGQIGGEGARKWLPNLINVIMAVICYKPAAALIITVGFVEIDNSDKIIDWIRGVVTLVLSIIALKGLMSLFAPIGVAVGSAAAAGGGIAGGLMGMAGSFAGGQMGGGGEGGAGGSGGSGTSAADQAGFMDKSGPASGGSGGGSEAGGSAQQQANTSVPAQQGAAAGEGAAAAGSGAAAGGAASGGAAAGGASAGAAAGGPASIAIVAAEAAKGIADKSGNTMGKGD